MAVKQIVLSDRQEWLKARSGRIGGSDASAVIGLNPYLSNVDLWRIKTGQVEQKDISDKDYVRYGIRAEQYLRELFQLDYPRYAVIYQENNMFLNDKYPFAHASLDGWLIEKDTGRFGVWECKTTNILQSMQKEKWNDRIPDNYYVQLLHYLLVTEFDFAILKAQLKYSFSNGEEVYLQTKHYRIERDEVSEDLEYLAKEEKKFWQQVQEKRKPNLILPSI